MTGSKIPALRILACLLAALILLVFISPEIGVYGRGLRTALPAFSSLFGLAILRELPVLIRTLKRMALPLAFGLLFMSQAAARFCATDNASMHLMINNYVFTPLITLSVLVTIAFIIELGTAEAQFLQKTVVIVWGVSLGVGIPALLSQIGIARTAMLDEDIGYQEFLHRQGVGSYTYYTAFGVAFPFMLRATLSWGWRTRAVAWLCLAGGVVATAVSTFTMANALMVGGTAGMLLFMGSGKSRILSIAFLGVLLIAGPPILELGAENSKQLEFIHDKAIRLFNGISSEGLAGDETTRGDMVLDSMATVIDSNWLLGYLEGETPMVIGGHSSLADSLVLFGFPGTLLWVGLMGCLVRLGLRQRSAVPDQLAVLLGWGFFLSSGVLNPTWYDAAFICSLAAFSMAQQTNSSRLLKSPSLPPDDESLLGNSQLSPV